MTEGVLDWKRVERGRKPFFSRGRRVEIVHGFYGGTSVSDA